MPRRCAFQTRSEAISLPLLIVTALVHAGVVVTFFGLHAHGRVPVMLNFTAGEANLKAAIKAAGVKKVLTAKRFIDQAKLDELIVELKTVAEVVWLDDVRFLKR